MKPGRKNGIYKIKGMKTPIYSIADNIITALGFDTASNIRQIAKGNTGVSCWDDPTIYPHPVWVSKIKNTQLRQAIQSLHNATEYTSLEQLFILSIRDCLQQCSIDIRQKDTLIIIASTKGNIHLLEKKHANKFSPKRVQLGSMAQQVQHYFGNPNTPVVVCNACISGVLALDVAKQLLQQGLYQNIIVSGGDLVTEFTLAGFQSFKAMSQAPCKPYDKHRDGINLGEGVGTMILSRKQVSSASSTITIEGGASSNDANHISGPSRTGDGLYLAIKKALKEAGCSAQELDYLSMHGTATVYNDEMESKALNLAKLSKVPMNSFKGYIGHTLGAAGLIESILAVQSLKNNVLYASLGYQEHGVPQPLHIIQKTQDKALYKCLKTASGFGGCNAAVVFVKNNTRTDS